MRYVGSDVRLMQLSDLAGPADNVSAGFIIGGNATVGFDEDMNRTFIRTSFGVGETIGVSWGINGKTYLIHKSINE